MMTSEYSLESFLRQPLQQCFSYLPVSVLVPIVLCSRKVAMGDLKMMIFYLTLVSCESCSFAFVTVRSPLY